MNGEMRCSAGSPKALWWVPQNNLCPTISTLVVASTVALHTFSRTVRHRARSKPSRLRVWHPLTAGFGKGEPIVSASGGKLHWLSTQLRHILDGCKQNPKLQLFV